MRIGICPYAYPLCIHACLSLFTVCSFGAFTIRSRSWFVRSRSVPPLPLYLCFSAWLVCVDRGHPPVPLARNNSLSSHFCRIFLRSPTLGPISRNLWIP